MRVTGSQGLRARLAAADRRPWAAVNRRFGISVYDYRCSLYSWLIWVIFWRPPELECASRAIVLLPVVRLAQLFQLEINRLSTDNTDSQSSPIMVAH